MKLHTVKVVEIFETLSERMLQIPGALVPFVRKLHQPTAQLVTHYQIHGVCAAFFSFLLFLQNPEQRHGIGEHVRTERGNLPRGKPNGTNDMGMVTPADAPAAPIPERLRTIMMHARPTTLPDGHTRRMVPIVTVAHGIRTDTDRLGTTVRRIRQKRKSDGNGGVHGGIVLSVVETVSDVAAFS